MLYLYNSSSWKPYCNRVVRRYLGVIRAFEKEDAMLNGVLEDLGAPVGGGLGPKCFLSRKDRFTVTEDLTLQGFTTCTGFDLEHAECAVREFARFHAASLLRPESEIEDRYPGVMYESLFLKMPGGVDGILESFDKGMRELFGEFFQDLDEASIDRTLSLAYETIVEYVKPSKRYRNVILHGDPWGNNLLYRYDDKGRPLQTRLVDFQASRFAPPALELVEFLYLGSEPGFRRRHRDHLLRVYYDHLGDILEGRGVPVSSVLPFDSFLESCLCYERFGVAINLYYAYLTRIPRRFLGRLASSPEAFLAIIVGGDPDCPRAAFHHDHEYRQQVTERLLEVISYFEGLGPLQQ